MFVFEHKIVRKCSLIRPYYAHLGVNSRYLHNNSDGIIIGPQLDMKRTGTKLRDLLLVIGIVVALFAGILSAVIYYNSDPVTEPATQESKISNENQSTILTGILSLAFKNGLELVQIVRDSN